MQIKAIRSIVEVAKALRDEGITIVSTITDQEESFMMLRLVENSYAFLMSVPGNMLSKLTFTGRRMFNFGETYPEDKMIYHVPLEGSGIYINRGDKPKSMNLLFGVNIKTKDISGIYLSETDKDNKTIPIDILDKHISYIEKICKAVSDFYIGKYYRNTDPFSTYVNPSRLLGKELFSAPVDKDVFEYIGEFKYVLSKFVYLTKHFLKEKDNVQHDYSVEYTDGVIVEKRKLYLDDNKYIGLTFSPTKEEIGFIIDIDGDYVNFTTNFHKPKSQLRYSRKGDVVINSSDIRFVGLSMNEVLKGRVAPLLIKQVG